MFWSSVQWYEYLFTPLREPHPHVCKPIRCYINTSVKTPSKTAEWDQGLLKTDVTTVFPPKWSRTEELRSCEDVHVNICKYNSMWSIGTGTSLRLCRYCWRARRTMTVRSREYYDGCPSVGCVEPSANVKGAKVTWQSITSKTFKAAPF